MNVVIVSDDFKKWIQKLESCCIFDEVDVEEERMCFRNELVFIQVVKDQFSWKTDFIGGFNPDNIFVYFDNVK